MGYAPAFDKLNAIQSALTSPTAFLQLIANNMISVGVLGVALGIIAAISIFTGFSAVFIIPLLILLVVVNWFAFPMELLSGSSTFLVPVVVFLNICAILTYIEFVRGPS